MTKTEAYKKADFIIWCLHMTQSLIDDGKMDDAKRYIEMALINADKIYVECLLDSVDEEKES